MLTRQPLEGRTKAGGLKLGEMEMQCGISHGLAHFVIERSFHSSDPFTVDACAKCGLMANNDKVCSVCESEDIRTINCAYASKLLFQELYAMGIVPRIFSK